MGLNKTLRCGWENAKLSLKKVMVDASVTGEDIKAIGISYQMHGLVCVDKNLEVLRPVNNLVRFKGCALRRKGFW